jgi:FMN phosphatase YigB (HAD superfamily)
MNKLILTDIDGVFLNWELAFTGWMIIEKGIEINHEERFHQRYGKLALSELSRHISEFNESSYGSAIPPIEGAKKGVKTLREAGCSFHAITSFGSSHKEYHNRKDNLSSAFGRGTFKKIFSLDFSVSKEKILSRYSNPETYFWIEDTISNADIGHKLGFKTILMNRTGEKKNVPYDQVSSWDELQDKLLVSL